jgi:2-keto-3-deoxy-L-fuconate dehydrogenase
MAGRLEGKRVILTDPGYYSGPGIVKVFREEGAELFADDRDLTLPGAAEDLVASVGHVDILIANHARPFAFTPAQEGTDEEMERLMSSIFYPMHRMIKAVLPQMLARKNGKIVVTSSVNAIKGRAGGATLYSAARGAQIAYMRYLAHEVAPHINVNATAQTYVDNPTYALFLAGPESDFFYGQVIPFAGGWAV